MNIPASISRRLDYIYAERSIIAVRVYENANARLYDPTNGRFFSPDPYVQVPDFTQAYNRYSYCMNNPVMFVDPTGLSLKIGNWRQQQDSPLSYNMVDGMIVIELPEVVITPHDEPWEEFDYFPGSASSSDYSNGDYWTASNANGTSITSGGTSGGNPRNGPIHSTPDNTNNNKKNDNIDIASKTMTVVNLYTMIESSTYFNPMMRTWRDKLDVIRSMDYHGNQHTGGMINYGKMMSNRYTNAGKALGFVGAALSFYQFEQATTIEEQLEFGFDTFIGVAGAVAPEYFGIPATIWFLGGKQVVFWYGKNVIAPMIEEGINPGLMINHPFK